MEVLKEFYGAFKKIAETSSRKEKTAILDDFLTEAYNEDAHKDVTKILFLMYSGTVTFGVSDLHKDIVPGDYEMDLESFFFTMTMLAKRELTGAAAMEALRELCGACQEHDIEIVRWCLRKDPKVGLGIKSINNSLPNPIPTFEQQKPLSLNSGDGLTTINWDLIPDSAGKLMVEIKYDGNRAYLICPREGDAYFLSASGFELPAVQSVAKRIASSLNLKGVVLDGELFYKSVEETGSIVRKVEDQGLSTGICFYCIGGLTLEEWNASFKYTTDVTNMVMRNRVKSLYDKYLATNLNEAIKLATWFQLSKCAIVEGKNLERIKELMEASVKEGFEGLVIKDADAFYARNKENRAGWWKVKFIDTYDAVIVDFQEGTGKNIGKLGAFIVEHNGVRSNVGGSYKNPETGESSLSDEMRLEYWLNRHTLTDKTIRLLSYGLTREGKFRHASFINFHGEK